MKPKDDYDKWQDSHCHVKERMIYFGSETFYDDETGESGVDFASAGRTIKNLLYLDRESDSDIELHYNSPGGDWSHGMAIYDCIKGLRSHVKFIGYGCVRSMGTIIIQSCGSRFLTPYCRFMVHVGTDGFYGHTIDAHRSAEESKVITNQMYDIYLGRIREKNPSFELEKVIDMCRNDTYMSAQEAVDLGLADRVLGG